MGVELDFGFSETLGRSLVIPSPRGLPFLATNRAHEGRDHAGERIMSAQRVWKPVGSVNSNADIERLRLELASFNKQIEQLEKQHPDAHFGRFLGSLTNKIARSAPSPRRSVPS